MTLIGEKDENDGEISRMTLNIDLIGRISGIPDGRGVLGLDDTKKEGENELW